MFVWIKFRERKGRNVVKTSPQRRVSSNCSKDGRKLNKASEMEIPSTFPTANPKYTLKPPEWKACAAWANAYGDTGPARLLGGPGGAPQQQGKRASRKEGEQPAALQRAERSAAGCLEPEPLKLPRMLSSRFVPHPPSRLTAEGTHC